MYGLSREVVKPGCSFRDVDRASQGHRIVRGRRRRILRRHPARHRAAKRHRDRAPRRALDPDRQRAAGRRRMGGDPRGHHRAQARRGAHHPSGALRRADRSAEPRPVPRPAEARTRNPRRGRAIRRALPRHRRIQERQRFARTPDRRRIAEVGGRHPAPMHRTGRFRRPPRRRRVRDHSDRGQDRGRRHRSRGADLRGDPGALRMPRSPGHHRRQHRHCAGAAARRRFRPDPEERGSGDVRRQGRRTPHPSLLRAGDGRPGQGAPQSGNGPAPGDHRRRASRFTISPASACATTASPAAKPCCAGAIPNAA